MSLVPQWWMLAMSGGISSLKTARSPEAATHTSSTGKVEKKRKEKSKEKIMWAPSGV